MVQFMDNHFYIGGYQKSQKQKQEWVKPKVDEYVESVQKMGEIMEISLNGI